MPDPVPPLKFEVAYNTTLGIFEAKLENGARFTFGRHEVSGKLENALNLYRKAVMQMAQGGYRQLPPTREDALNDVAEAYASGVKPQKVGKTGKKEFSLEDLDL